MRLLNSAQPSSHRLTNLIRLPTKLGFHADSLAIDVEQAVSSVCQPFACVEHDMKHLHRQWSTREGQERYESRCPVNSKAVIHLRSEQRKRWKTTSSLQVRYYSLRIAKYLPIPDRHRTTTLPARTLHCDIGPSASNLSPESLEH